MPQLHGVARCTERSPRIARKYARSRGKRYARTDELGVPFAVTVDHRSLEDGTVTVRERDSCQQVRVCTKEVLPLVKKLCAMQATWKEATQGMEKQTAAAE